MMHPAVKPSYTEITNALNNLQNLSFLLYAIIEPLQRFESLHVHDAARKQSSILTYFNWK